MATVPKSAKPKAAPKMLKKSWSLMPPIASEDKALNVGKHLDDFVEANNTISKRDLMLRYLEQLDAAVNNSQLLQAELVYLYFTGDNCPLNFNTADDYWHVYSTLWCTSGHTMTKVKEYMQSDFLRDVRQVVVDAKTRNTFPATEAGEDHFRMMFLNKFIGSLECRESLEKIIKESAIFFSKEQIYDTKPHIVQLMNCVLDLQTRVFRKGSPSDLTSRRSSISVPEKWLKQPSLIDSEGDAMRQLAWDVIWSIFSKGEEGQPHANDQFELLGEQDEANFMYFLHILARLLEGNPLAKCLFFYSARGRNSKGVIQKIIKAFLGGYCVPVKSSVFQPDRRNENEHGAADLTRVGARVGFGNEVPKSAWSNGVYKNKNSSDPIIARACGGTKTVEFYPTITYGFGTNDVPHFEQPTKNSEKDRTIVIYLPNRYLDAGEEPSSPRCFPKDTGLEARVQTPEFALGLLLILIDIRRDVAETRGGRLDDIVQAGTPTSKYWLDKWVAAWTMEDKCVAEDASENESKTVVEVAKNTHNALYTAKKMLLLKCAIEENSVFKGSKKTRWSKWLATFTAAGRSGSFLFQKTTAASRKGTEQPAFEVLPVDIFMYDKLFPKEVFGDYTKYLCNPFEQSQRAWRVGFKVDFEAPMGAIPLRRRLQVCETYEIINLQAMELRDQQGPAVTGERRPEHLKAHLDRARAEGKPVQVSGVDVSEVADSPFRMSHCGFDQIDELGRAYEGKPGTQGATRESRPVLFQGLCVGELDLRIAFYQLLCTYLRNKMPEEDFIRDFGIFRLLIDNSDQWKEGVAKYYAIEKEDAKKIISRILFDGNVRPDAEWDPSRGTDCLPCLLEVCQAIDSSFTYLCQQSDEFKAIYALPKTQNAANPRATALALFLQDLEHKYICEVTAEATKQGARIMSYVFDGVYVLAKNDEHLRHVYRAVASHMYKHWGIQVALKDVSGATLKLMVFREGDGPYAKVARV